MARPGDGDDREKDRRREERTVRRRVSDRSAVPDTQDILGRYEIIVDDHGQLREYGLVERYRRGESREERQ